MRPDLCSQLKLMSENGHLQLQLAADDDMANAFEEKLLQAEISHCDLFSEDMLKLCANREYSDASLKVWARVRRRPPLQVEGTVIYVNRAILAARSDYFRAMFFGPLSAAGLEAIELQDTSLRAFTPLLRYIYTGRLSLAGLREELVLDILGNAQKYGFEPLVTSIAAHLQFLIDGNNFCTIFNISQMYSLPTLTQYCFDYADRNAAKILNNEGFLQLTQSAVELLIKRDSFCAKEILIFHAVHRWIQANSPLDYSTLLDAIRLPLISVDDLLNVIRPTDLIGPDEMLDAIQQQRKTERLQLMHRGVLMPNVNLATIGHATVRSGEFPESLFGPRSVHFEADRQHTRHAIKDAAETTGIVIALNNPYIINCLELSLLEKDNRVYSYFIESSMDCEDWMMIVDYREYLCRSVQLVYFDRRPIKYIRIVGTMCNNSSHFVLTALKIMYVSDPQSYDPVTAIRIPNDNMAEGRKNAIVVEGVSRSRHALINGETTSYDWDTGYTCHQIGSGAIAVQLPQPFIISSMRLLLWDCDARSYSYYVEVSKNARDWHMIVDRSRHDCRSWQSLTFKPVPAVFIRITGTRNTANEVFHCVHFECPRALDDSAIGDKEVQQYAEPDPALNMPRDPPLEANHV